MEYLNLFELFAVYVFGSPMWAIMGVAMIILAITYMGKWSPILRYVYILGFLFASFFVIGQTFLEMTFFMGAMMWFSYGIWRFIFAYRGQT